MPITAVPATSGTQERLEGLLKLAHQDNLLSLTRMEFKGKGFDVDSFVFSVPTMAFSLGVAFLLVVIVLAQLLTPPPKGYKPGGTPSAAAKSSAANAKKSV